MEPFIGTEAVASGTVTRGQLRWNYRAVYPDVYIAKDQVRTLRLNTYAAWLWTARTGIIAGRAAAALQGVRIMDPSTPIEIIGPHTRRHRGIVMRAERIADDEIRPGSSPTITQPGRTALDLGRYLPRDLAVEYLDQLARSCDLTAADVAPLLERYRGARGISRARMALSLMDGRSRCPEETRMRLLLHDFGLPAPRANIRLTDGRDVTSIGMGWEDVRLGVSYFEPPRPGGSAIIQDLRHHELVARLGWTEMGFAGAGHARSVAYRVRDELRHRQRLRRLQRVASDRA